MFIVTFSVPALSCQQRGRTSSPFSFLYGLVLGLFGFFSFLPPFLAAAFVVYVVREQPVSGWFWFCGAF